MVHNPGFILPSPRVMDVTSSPATTFIPFPNPTFNNGLLFPPSGPLILYNNNGLYNYKRKRINSPTSIQSPRKHAYSPTPPHPPQRRHIMAAVPPNTLFQNHKQPPLQPHPHRPLAARRTIRCRVVLQPAMARHAQRMPVHRRRRKHHTRH